MTRVSFIKRARLSIAIELRTPDAHRKMHSSSFYFADGSSCEPRFAFLKKKDRADVNKNIFTQW